MLIDIIKKEILENIHSHRLAIFSLVCFILVPFSLFINSLNYKVQLDNYNEQQRLIQAERAGNKNYDISHLIAYRKPDLLMMFANGIGGRLPASYGISEEGYSPADYPSVQSTVTEIVGNLDYLFILQMVIGLIAMLFSVDAIAAEKESGTLRVIFMNSVSRNSVILGKLFGGYLCLIVPFTVSFLAGILSVSVIHTDVLQVENLLRISLIFLFSSLFICIFCVVGIAVSSRTVRVRSAVIVSLAIWISLQLLLPKIGTIVSRAWKPMVSEVVQSVEIDQLRNVIDKEEAEETSEASIKFWGHQFLMSDMRDSLRWIEWLKIQQPISFKYKEKLNSTLRAKREYYDHFEKDQDRISTYISSISPGFAISNLLCDIAGTGKLPTEKFLEDVKAFEHSADQQIYSVGFVQKMIVNGEMGIIKRGNIGRIKEIPRFNYFPPSLAEIVGENVSSLIVLLLWPFVSVLCAIFWFHRYDIR